MSDDLRLGLPPAARSGVARSTLMGASPTSSSRIVHAVQRLILRTGRTPLGRLWNAAYRGIARAVTAYLTWGDTGAAAYLRGGVATGDLVPGVSDVDTTVVFALDPRGPGIAGVQARRRWGRLARALPAAELLVETPMVFDDVALAQLAGSDAFTFGLDRPAATAPGPAAYFGQHASFDWLRTIERPGLYGLGADWRLLAGPERRPHRPAQDVQGRRIAAWLELLYWWRWAFPACVDPRGPRTAALCLKLVAEPARVWLWLAHGERPRTRVDVLCAGLRRMPEEEPTLRRALALHHALRDSPAPPLDDALHALARISARIADRLVAEVQDAGGTEVRLAGAEAPEMLLAAGPGDAVGGEPVEAGGRGRGAHRLPLLDWRALVCPPLPDESFSPLPGDPGEPAALAAAASLPTGPYAALRSGGLMVLPAGPWWRTRLRAVKCPATDPVLFALDDGESTATFPGVSGWSAHDVARRAVAEHRAWLAGEPGPWAAGGSAAGNGHALGVLFTAARGGLFDESLRAGDPELTLTVTQTAGRLAERSPDARTVVEEALGRYREFLLSADQPEPQTVTAMRDLVLGLPSYDDAVRG